MGEFLHVIASVAAGIAFFFVAGLWLGTAFLLKAGWVPSVRAHPRTTRWLCAAFGVAFMMLLFFVFTKLGRPIYWGYIAVVSVAATLWGFLSRIEKRFLWKEFATLSFWIPERFSRTTAKNGM